MTPRHERLLKLLATVLIAIVPAVFGYFKAARETDQASREADAGYKALVTSVRHLEEMVKAQQATIDALAHFTGVAPTVQLAPLPHLPSDTSAALQQQEAAAF